MLSLLLSVPPSLIRSDAPSLHRSVAPLIFTPSLCPSVAPSLRRSVAPSLFSPLLFCSIHSSLHNNSFFFLIFNFFYFNIQTYPRPAVRCRRMLGGWGGSDDDNGDEETDDSDLDKLGWRITCEMMDHVDSSFCLSVAYSLRRSDDPSLCLSVPLSLRRSSLRRSFAPSIAPYTITLSSF